MIWLAIVLEFCLLQMLGYWVLGSLCVCPLIWFEK
jgi:hypothetical protein